MPLSKDHTIVLIPWQATNVEYEICDLGETLLSRALVSSTDLWGVLRCARVDLSFYLNSDRERWCHTSRWLELRETGKGVMCVQCNLKV